MDYDKTLQVFTFNFSAGYFSVAYKKMYCFVKYKNSELMSCPKNEKNKNKTKQQNKKQHTS